MREREEKSRYPKGKVGSRNEEAGFADNSLLMDKAREKASTPSKIEASFPNPPQSQNFCCLSRWERVEAQKRKKSKKKDGRSSKDEQCNN